MKLLFKQEVKITSPDYIDVNKDQAVKDFKLRIEHYAARFSLCISSSIDL